MDSPAFLHHIWSDVAKTNVQNKEKELSRRAPWRGYSPVKDTRWRRTMGGVDQPHRNLSSVPAVSERCGGDATTSFESCCLSTAVISPWKCRRGNLQRAFPPHPCVTRTRAGPSNRSGEPAQGARTVTPGCRKLRATLPSRYPSNTKSNARTRPAPRKLYCAWSRKRVWGCQWGY